MSRKGPEPLQHLQADPAPQLQEPLLGIAVAFPFILRAALEEFVDTQGLLRGKVRLRRGWLLLRDLGLLHLTTGPNSPQLGACAAQGCGGLLQPSVACRDRPSGRAGEGRRRGGGGEHAAGVGAPQSRTRWFSGAVPEGQRRFFLGGGGFPKWHTPGCGWGVVSWGRMIF